MSKKPLVSVIIVNYNGKGFIEECLDSVLKSDYPHFEIVVIDNASTDSSFEYLQKKYGTNKRVRLIRSNQQLYFTGGCNLGAKNSKGKKLIFLNSDAVVDKNWIKELVLFGKNKPKYLVQPKILFYGQKNIIDNAGGRYTFFGFGHGIGRDEKDIGQYDKNTQIDYVNGTCFMIDKDFFWQLDGFDENFRYFYEDVDLSLRARKAGGKCWCCFKSIIYHKGSLTFKQNLPRENLLFNIRKNRIRTIIKNFSGGEKLLRLTLLLEQYFILTIQDLLTLKKERMFTTIKSILINL